MAPTTLSTRCCIAGGEPAGMMLGLLLARAGIAVLVLEKHADFLRDFRGDTVHPSTLQVLHERCRSGTSSISCATRASAIPAFACCCASCPCP